MKRYISLVIVITLIFGCGDSSKKSSIVFDGVYKSDDTKIEFKGDEFTYSRYESGSVVKEIKGKFEQHTSTYFEIDQFGEKVNNKEEVFLVLKNKSFKTWIELNPRQTYYKHAITNYLFENPMTYIDYFTDPNKDCYDPYFENHFKDTYTETWSPTTSSLPEKVREFDGMLILTNQYGSINNWGGLISFHHSYNGGNIPQFDASHFIQK